MSPLVIFRNIGAVWVGFGVQLAVTLYLTPILIAQLGSEGYGVWILIQSFTGYYGLIDIGLRAGVTQSVTKRIASGDKSTLISYISGVLPLLAKAAIIVLFAAIILSFVLSETLKVSQSLSDDLVPMVLFQAIGIGISLVSFPFASVLVGKQRYDLSEGIAVATRFISLGSTLCVLHFTNSLFYLSLATLGVNVFDQLVRCWIAFQLIPDLKGIRPRSNRIELSELYRVGGWNFVVNISQQMLQRLNTIIAAYWFSVANLVPFSLAGSLAEHSSKITTLAARVLFPSFSHLSQNGTPNQTRQLFQVSSRISLTVSLVTVTTGLIWFEPFMNLWLTAVANKEIIIPSARSLFLFFGLINVINSVRSIGWQLIMGNDRVDFMGKVMALESVSAILLSVLFGFWLGVIGLVLGNLVVLALSTLFIWIPAFSKLISMPIFANLKSIFVRPVLHSIVVGSSLYLWSEIIFQPDNWIDLILFCALPSVIILTITAPVLLTRSERSIVYHRVFRLIRLS